MKFEAFVYDTTTGEPMSIEVRNINVQHRVVVGGNGMQYRHFKLFYVRNGEKKILEQIGDCDSLKHGRGSR